MNIQTRSGETPLHIVARKGNKAVARVLLNHGAELTATLPDGSTPLQLATDNGYGDFDGILAQPSARFGSLKSLDSDLHSDAQQERRACMLAGMPLCLTAWAACSFE